MEVEGRTTLAAGRWWQAGSRVRGSEVVYVYVDEEVFVQTAAVWKKVGGGEGAAV